MGLPVRRQRRREFVGWEKGGAWMEDEEEEGEEMMVVLVLVEEGEWKAREGREQEGHDGLLEGFFRLSCCWLHVEVEEGSVEEGGA
jgi:hypothetical protein